MLQTVVVSKVGSVFRSEGKTPVGGENGDTEGVLRELASRSDLKVVYLGVARGEMPENVELIPFDDKGLSEFTLEGELDERLKPAFARLDELEAKVFVQVSGYSATLATPGNPWGIMVQACGVKYIAPLLLALHHRSKDGVFAKRLIVNNDPRNYPREHEMTIWSECRPAAVLSQENRIWDRTIRGMNCRTVAVSSGAENWWSRGKRVFDPDTLRTRSCVVLAHAHMRDSRLAKNRDAAWCQILNDYVTAENPIEIYGKDWEYFSKYDPLIMKGHLKGTEVDPLLQDTVCGPCIPISPGFLTGKLRQYAINGAWPLPYAGSIEELTYDHEGKYVPLNHWSRVRSSSDLKRLVNYEAGQNVVDWIRELEVRTRPNFTMLHECVNHFLEGGEMDVDRFGGYLMSGEISE